MVRARDEIDVLLNDTQRLAAEAERQLGGGSAASAPASDGPARPIPPPAPVDRRRLRQVLRIEVPVIVELAQRSMRIGQVMQLTAGAIVEFDKPADADLNLMVNNKCIGQGRAVKVGENFGLSITSIGTPREKIEALSSSIGGRKVETRNE